MIFLQEFRGLEEGEDNARVKNRQVAKTAAEVLQLESAGELCFALTTLRTETRGLWPPTACSTLYVGDTIQQYVVNLSTEPVYNN